MEMKENYRENYIKIYIWRSLSIVVSFLSFFIVIPYLSSSPELFGIYTFCTTFQMYLSYADIGFLSAGQKYAAEAFARGERQEEVNILGFVGAVLFAMILPFSIGMCIFAYNPDLVINGVAPEKIDTIKSLFLIMAFVSPIQVLLQRLTQAILTIRVKDYISSRIDVIGSIIKILSVLVFFTQGRYALVPYFIFINLTTIVCSFIIIGTIRKTEDYDFLSLLKSIKFSKKYFDFMKKMSFTSLGLTISWIICYELDLIYVGKFFSVTEVAYYAVCLSLINFLRSLFSVIYGPYSQRFNHFIALRDLHSFKELLNNLIRYTFPICVFITSILVFSSEYFITFWVGESYEISIPILKALAVFVLFTFITQPGSFVCISTEQYKLLNASSVLSPVVFIFSFYILYWLDSGILSFAIAKIIMASCNSIIMLYGLRNYTNVWNNIKVFIPSLLIIGIIGVVCYYLYPMIFTTMEKNKVLLIELIATMGLFGVIYISLTAMMDSKLRSLVKNKIITSSWQKKHS